jgi:hypothetical protein
MEDLRAICFGSLKMQEKKISRESVESLCKEEKEAGISKESARRQYTDP